MNTCTCLGCVGVLSKPAGLHCFLGCCMRRLTLWRLWLCLRLTLWGRGSGCVFLTWCGAPPGGVEKKTSPGETRRSRQPCTSHCEGRVLGAPDVAVSGGEVYETSNMRCVEYVFVLGLLTCSCVALSVSPGPSSPLSLRSDRSEPRAPLCAGSSSLPCLHGDRLDFYETTSQ
jgi:hypothetical protein